MYKAIKVGNNRERVTGDERTNIFSSLFEKIGSEYFMRMSSGKYETIKFKVKTNVLIRSPSHLKSTACPKHNVEPAFTDLYCGNYRSQNGPALPVSSVRPRFSNDFKWYVYDDYER